MESDSLKKVARELSTFLFDHKIEHRINAVCIEKEWTDFRLTINDSRQMERINTWLKDDLKQALSTWTDIQIDAPNPVAGKESELRVRIYEL